MCTINEKIYRELSQLIPDLASLEQYDKHAYRVRSDSPLYLVLNVLHRDHDHINAMLSMCYQNQRGKLTLIPEFTVNIMLNTKKVYIDKINTFHKEHHGKTPSTIEQHNNRYWYDNLLSMVSPIMTHDS